MVYLLSNGTAANQPSGLMEVHGHLQNNMVTIHSVERVEITLVFGCGHILEGFIEGTIKPGAGMGQERQASKNTLPLSGDGGGGAKLQSLFARFVKLGKFSILSPRGEQSGGLISGEFTGSNGENYSE